MDYVRDPAEIYRQSFEIVRREADLARFDAGEAEVAVRLIHACGMVEIASALVFSTGAVTAGVAALKAGCTIFCDAEMVAAGIIRARLQADNEIICTLNDAQTPERAKQVGNTRSAAAVDFWDDRLAGAIVVIGNAPTVLFHLLERLDEGAPKPALIIGLPVGFVGAAESKDALLARSFDETPTPDPSPQGGGGLGSAKPLGGFGAESVVGDSLPLEGRDAGRQGGGYDRTIPFITLKGRLGGSAMASAAVNALAGLAGDL